MRRYRLVMRRSGVQIPEAAPRKVAALQRRSAFDVVRKPVGLDRFVSPRPFLALSSLDGGLVGCSYLGNAYWGLAVTQRRASGSDDSRRIDRRG